MNIAEIVKNCFEKLQYLLRWNNTQHFTSTPPWFLICFIKKKNVQIMKIFIQNYVNFMLSKKLKIFFVKKSTDQTCIGDTVRCAYF